MYTYIYIPYSQLHSYVVNLTYAPRYSDNDSENCHQNTVWQIVDLLRSCICHLTRIRPAAAIYIYN